MSVQILIGNSLEILPTLEKNSVHCSVTSPPYYGLRKYQGDQRCDWPEVEYSPMPGLPPIAVEPMFCALGHEPTIEAYVGHLVAIYREVWRVLRNDGVAWIVMGDSYVSQLRGGRKGSPKSQAQEMSKVQTAVVWNKGRHTHFDWSLSNGTRQGDLMLVPHRLALALQADGWLVRNDDVWAKVAPMPESVSGWRWERHRVRAPNWKPKRYIGKGEERDSQSASERIKMNVASARQAGIDHETGAVSVGWCVTAWAWIASGLTFRRNTLWTLPGNASGKMHHCSQM